MIYEQLKITEPSANVTNIGYYGKQWIDFMKNHHPKLFRQLKKNQTLFTVAQSVNKSAQEYKDLLDHQYEQMHPRPYEWEGISEHRSWKFTRDFYTEHEVMVDCVLIPLTQP